MPLRIPVVAHVLGLALAAGCADGCGCDEEGSAGADATSDAAPAPPDGLLWEVSIGGGAETLGSLGELLPDRARALLPAEPGALLERVAPDAPVADRVPPDADVHGLAVRVNEDDQLVLAARVHLDEGAQPLGPDVELIDGAPDDARWIGRAPAADRPAALLDGDVVVVGRDPVALGRAHRYVARALVSGDAPDGVVVRLPEGFVSQRLRRAADRAVASHAAQALAAIEAERARHDEPPAYGDPDRLVAALRDGAGRIVGYLTDIGEVRLSLRPEPAGLVLDVDAHVTPGSPLARALEDAPAGSPVGLAALPEDVALAWSTRSHPDDEESFIVRTLRRTAGERLDGDALRRLEAADEAIGRARGETLLTAFGGSADGPWALVATGPVRQEFPADALRDVLAATWVRDVVGALLGCEGALAPTAWWATEAGTRRARLCGEVALEVTAADHSAAAAILRSETPLTAEVGARLFDRTTRAGFGGHPDVSRALAVLDRDPAIAAGVVVPSRLLTAASLFALEPLRAIAADAIAGRPAPLVWALAPTEQGIRLRLVGTSAALSDLAALLDTFLAAD